MRTLENQYRKSHSLNLTSMCSISLTPPPPPPAWQNNEPDQGPTPLSLEGAGGVKIGKKTLPNRFLGRKNEGGLCYGKALW